MQQYFDIESGSGTLTVFHTPDSVSFDVEHYGNFKMDDTTLLEFLQDTASSLTVYHNAAEEYPELAERRPNLYTDEDEQVAELEKQDDGSLQIDIQTGQKYVTVTLTPEQTETLEDSINLGEVERYEDGQYPVESVGKDGVRNRAEHE